jgi:phage baseplate assembly protein W
MATFTGFSTLLVNTPQNDYNFSGSGSTHSTVGRPLSNRKYRVTDKDLIVRDLLNAFNIKQGDKPGMPSYGTTIWSYIFEPNTDDVRQEIETEVRRVVDQDPRITLESVSLYSSENTIVIEMEISFDQFSDFDKVSIALSTQTGTATLA